MKQPPLLPDRTLLVDAIESAIFARNNRGRLTDEEMARILAAAEWALYASAYKPEKYADADEIECPACHGQAVIRGPQKNMPWKHCRYCFGTGAVAEQRALDFSPSS